MSPWSFCALPGPQVEALAQDSIGLAALGRLAGRPVPLEALAARVRSADPRRQTAAPSGSVVMRATWSAR